MSIDTIFNSQLVSTVYGQLKSKYLRIWNNYIANPPSDAVTEVWPRVYVGNLQAALSRNIIEELGITHIVTAVIGVDMSFQESVEYLYVPLLDNQSQSIADVFKVSNAFIGKALQDPNARVLVHCMVGASRSATLVAAYIMSETGFNSAHVLDIIKQKRPIINPNPYFREQLQNKE